MIYGGKYSTKKYLSKFMYDNLKDSMIVNLTENRFLQQVQKIEFINWDLFGIYYAARRKLLSKNVQLCNILPRNYLSYIFEFQLVPFVFSLILGDPFMVKGGGTFFKKMLFMWGQILLGKFIGELLYSRD